MCRGGVGHNPFNVMSKTSFSRKNLVYASTWIKMNIFLFIFFIQSNFTRVRHQFCYLKNDESSKILRTINILNK